MSAHDDLRIAINYVHWCDSISWAQDEMKTRARRQVGNIYYKINGYYPSDRVLNEMLRPLQQEAAGVSPDPPSGVVY